LGVERFIATNHRVGWASGGTGSEDSEVAGGVAMVTSGRPVAGWGGAEREAGEGEQKQDDETRRRRRQDDETEAGQRDRDGGGRHEEEDRGRGCVLITTGCAIRQPF
jgi:hypothetical protein